VSTLAAIGRATYYFFVDDGSIVIGALIALFVVGALAIRQPFPNAEVVAGPLLFVFVSALLVASLLHAAHQSGRAR
jgi:hypothetical protein